MGLGWADLGWAWLGWAGQGREGLLISALEGPTALGVVLAMGSLWLSSAGGL